MHDGLHARDGEVNDGSDGCSGRMQDAIDRSNEER